MDRQNKSKRDFLKTVAYAAPVIATFSVAPAVASIGSYAHKKPKRHHKSHGKGHQNHEHSGKQHKYFAKENRFFRKKERNESN